MTGTGYATTDYGAWGPFAVTIFFCIMFIGGCAGSTSCGIKVFRFQIIYAAIWGQIRRMIHPNGVFPAKYNGRLVTEDVTSSVMSFFFLFFVCFALLAFALAAMGLDPLTAMSAAGTAVANVGPGLGEIIGPAGNFAPLPDGAKWLLSLGMLLGRLELFTVTGPIRTQFLAKLIMAERYTPKQMIKRLVGFDTTSAKSNLELIGFVELLFD